MARSAFVSCSDQEFNTSTQPARRLVICSDDKHRTKSATDHTSNLLSDPRTNTHVGNVTLKDD